MDASPPLARNPGFHRLWSARVVSRFGSSLGYVVLLWITFTETGSALAVAYVGLAEFVPTVALGVFSGVLVDRFDRRRVIVLSTLGRSAAMGVLILALTALGFHLSIVLAACVVFTVCSTFFGPASQALLPQLVARADLANANGLFESTEAVVGIVGSGAAGVCIALLGAVPSLGFDAGCYLVGAILVGLIATAATASAPERKSGRFLAEVAEGFRYLRRVRALLELTLAALVVNFLFSVVLTFLVVFSTVTLHGSAIVYALLEAMLAAGGASGAIVVGRLGLTRFAGVLWVYAAFGQGILIVTMVLVPNALVAALAFLGAGVLTGLLNVTWLSSVQATVPERLQGRYLAIDTAISYGAIPAAQLLGGVLIVGFGVSRVFLAVGLASLGAGLLFATWSELRRFGYDARSRPNEA